MNSTLDVPGATLYYELRGSGPLVVLVAAPMDADSFAPLADLLATDHTVLTTDPRGINRSKVDDPGQDSTPELRADVRVLGRFVDGDSTCRRRKKRPVSSLENCWLSVMLPPAATMAPESACTMPGRSAHDSLRIKL